MFEPFPKEIRHIGHGAYYNVDENPLTETRLWERDNPYLHGPYSGYCQDYRYLDVQAIINGLISTERAPDMGLDTVPGWFAQNFQTAFENQTRASTNGFFKPPEDEEVHECWPSYDMLQRVPDDTGTPGTAQIGLYGIDIQEYQDRFEWLEFFTACYFSSLGENSSDFQERINDYYDDTLQIIDSAIRDLYQYCIPGGQEELCDPVYGANARMGPNTPDVKDFGEIAEGTTTPSQTQIQNAYALFFEKIICHEPDNNPNEPRYCLDQDPLFYNPNYHAVLQPILDEYYQCGTNGECGDPLYYQWLSAAYLWQPPFAQGEPYDPNRTPYNYPRYSFDTLGD